MVVAGAETLGWVTILTWPLDICWRVWLGTRIKELGLQGLGAVLGPMVLVSVFPLTELTEVTAELVPAVLLTVSHFWFLLMSPFLSTRAWLLAPRLEENVSWIAMSLLLMDIVPVEAFFACRILIVDNIFSSSA